MMTTEELAVWVVEFECKFMTTIEFLDSAVTIKDDITSEEPNAEKNPYWGHIEFQTLGK